MFKTAKQNAEKIEGLEAQVVDLEAQITTLTESEGATKDASIESVQTIASLNETVTANEATISEQVATIEAQELTITEANTKLESFDSEVEAKTQLSIASLGFKGEIPEASNNGESDSSESLYAEYRKLNAKSPAQAAIFWAENKDAIKSK